MFVCRDTTLSTFTGHLWKAFSELLYRSISDRLARKQKIDSAKFFFIRVIGIVIFQLRVSERCSNIWLVAAIEHAKFFEVGQHRQRGLVIPAVANRLEIEGGIVYSGMRLLCFNVKAHV